jgi:hypothetical protein
MSTSSSYIQPGHVRAFQAVTTQMYGDGHLQAASSRRLSSAGMRPSPRLAHSPRVSGHINRNLPLRRQGRPSPRGSP